MTAPPPTLAPGAWDEIPQGEATAFAVEAGARFRIVNHLGQQVVDFWAFNSGDVGEYLSMEHCRDRLYKLFFEPGDVLVSNLRRPLLRLLADTSPGRHDTLCAPCDALSYAALGLGPDHPNCRANFLRRMAALGHAAPVVPCPWNLFMDIPVDGAGRLSDRPSAAAAGDYVELEALAEVTVVCSPCPQRQIPISGVGREPRGVRRQVVSGPRIQCFRGKRS